jgi:hypothetical protein
MMHYFPINAAWRVIGNPAFMPVPSTTGPAAPVYEDSSTPSAFGKDECVKGQWTSARVCEMGWSEGDRAGDAERVVRRVLDRAGTKL